MKPTLWLTALLFAAGLFAGTATIASAQSDRTLGISCTEAGHIHCGENGRIGGHWHSHHWRHHARHY